MNNLYTNKKIILKRLFLILSAFFAVLSAKGQSEDGIKLDVPRLVPLSHRILLCHFIIKI